MPPTSGWMLGFCPQKVFWVETVTPQWARFGGAFAHWLQLNDVKRASCLSMLPAHECLLEELKRHPDSACCQRRKACCCLCVEHGCSFYIIYASTRVGAHRVVSELTECPGCHGSRGEGKDTVTAAGRCLKAQNGHVSWWEEQQIIKLNICWC